MRVSVVTVAFALLAAVACAEGKEASLKVNGIVDIVLERLAVNAVSEQSLPDLLGNENEKVLFVKVPATVEAHDGTLTGLEKLKRNGDATLRLEGSNKLVVDVDLVVDQLVSRYEYKTKLSWMNGPSGHFTATMGTTTMHVTASLDLTTSSCLLTLESVNLANVGDVEVHATGLGLTSPIFSSLLKMMMEKQRDQLKASVEDRVLKALKNGATDCNSMLPEGFEAFEELPVSMLKVLLRTAQKKTLA